MLATNRERGFTLVEMMITVAIIGILASIAVPAFQQYQNRSRRSEGYANLAAIAKLEKSYFTEYATYVPTAFSVPGPPLGPMKRVWSPAAQAEFDPIGYRPEGNVYFDYDVAVCPGSDCFTATAYGDTDANGAVSLLQYVQPSAAGVSVPGLTFPGFGTPIDPNTLQPIENAVALNGNGDLY